MGIRGGWKEVLYERRVFEDEGLVRRIKYPGGNGAQITGERVTMDDEQWRTLQSAIQ